jgi:hypothetical protein
VTKLKNEKEIYVYVIGWFLVTEVIFHEEI